jgi:hypothetical protein
MFFKSEFNRDLSKWSVDDNCNTEGMFDESPLEDKKEFWPKRK